MTAKCTSFNIETHLILQSSKESKIKFLNPESGVTVSDIEGAVIFVFLSFDEEEKLLSPLGVFTICVVDYVQYLSVIVLYGSFFLLHKSDKL